MSISLWEHQEQSVQLLRRSISAGKIRPMLKQPTGAGKTRTAAAIIESATSRGNRVVFIVDAISLIDQTVQSFWELGIRDVGVIQASHTMTDWSKPVQVASVQTLQRRGMPDVDMAIVDEAHVRNQWLEDQFSGEKWAKRPVIGLSATPWSKGLGLVYDDLIEPITMRQLIDKGMLLDFRVFAPSHPDLNGVAVTGGDYNGKQLGDRMANSGLIADIVSTWLRLGENRPTLCYCVDRAHAKKVQQRFVEAGVAAEYIDMNTDTGERARIQGRLERGETKVVCNIATLTKGVDWKIGCIIIARPTKSKMLHCLDMETEILTSHGWKTCDEVAVGDCAATLDTDTGRGRWASVVGKIMRPMEPHENWVEYHGPRSDFRVTGNHTMLARRKWDADYRKMTALEMADISSPIYTPSAVQMDQVGVPLTDAELYFIGIMMSDGTWTPTIGSISQSERHPAIIEKIEWCLRSCGIGYSKRRIDRPKQGVPERFRRWRFDFSVGKPKAHANSGQWRGVPIKSERVEGVTGFRHLVPYMDKDFAPALMAMSRRQLDKFLDGLWDGDGTKNLKADYTPRSMEICSARKLVVDRIQALCAINGYTANVRKEDGASRSTPIWIITITKKDWRTYTGRNAKAGSDARNISVNPATNEEVWCVETETGTIITRRRGKVMVMGNCQIAGRVIRANSGYPDGLVLDHSDNMLRLGLPTDIGSMPLCTAKKGERKTERQDPLPKECPSCGFLKAPKVRECPICKFTPETRSDLEEEDGELVQIGGKKRQFTMAEKQLWYSGLRFIQVQRGYKDGWTSNQYKTKFGVWPQGLSKIPSEPTPEIESWVRSQQIRYAKRKAA